MKETSSPPAIHAPSGKSGGFCITGAFLGAISGESAPLLSVSFAKRLYISLPPEKRTRPFKYQFKFLFYGIPTLWGYPFNSNFKFEEELIRSVIWNWSFGLNILKALQFQDAEIFLGKNGLSINQTYKQPCISEHPHSKAKSRYSFFASSMNKIEMENAVEDQVEKALSWVHLNKLFIFFGCGIALASAVFVGELIFQSVPFKFKPTIITLKNL